MEILSATVSDITEAEKLNSGIRHKQLEEYLRHGRAYVLKDRGQTVGLLCYGFFKMSIPYLEHLFIDESFRKQGLGLKLITKWEQEMYTLGHKYLMAGTQTDSTAWRFLEKCGYQKAGSFLLPDRYYYDLVYVKTVQPQVTKEEPKDVITDDKHRVLKEYFGYSNFRNGQAELVDAQLNGRDVFGIMPTGGGKSLCYQIPALLSSGVTLVVSPLISLMKDQVAALKTAGVAAAYINSSLSVEQIGSVLQKMLAGKYKIIYIAPERLMTKSFLEVVRKIKISIVAVDEAHCISQWGQDFRPSYLKIVDFLNVLPKRPVVAAFTATATGQVRDDVIRILDLHEPFCVVTGFDRPNLRFEVMAPKNKPATLYQLITARSDKGGIVYCSTRKEVERVCDTLCENGFSATRYHAGLTEEERAQNQDDFIYDRKSVMVATNAFGMGIDKSNVSYVIHYNMPKSMEAYYQEAGRAGRDGEPAECILLYSAGDIQTAKFLIMQTSENDELTEEQRQEVISKDLERLDKMIGYCRTVNCLRGYILDYFGQKQKGSCGNCGNCSVTTKRVDITTEAQMILSCVRRIHDRLGYYVGETVVVQVLRGSTEKRILQYELEKLSTYGLMKNIPRDDVKEMVLSLKLQGYLIVDSKYGGLKTTSKADEVLFCGESVRMASKKYGITHAAKPKKNTKQTAVSDASLFEVLKELRGAIASKHSLPAYVVFSNATLQDMAARKPTTVTEFLEVSGVGEHKAQKYGKLFTDEIKKYLKH